MLQDVHRGLPFLSTEPARARYATVRLPASIPTGSSGIRRGWEYAVLQAPRTPFESGAPGRTRTCDLPLSSGARVPVCATGAWGRDSTHRVTASSFSVTFRRSGTSEQLLSLFRTFDNYPLLLRALAGEVAAYRAAPGDFDRWRRDHAYFNPSALPLKNAKTHVLEFALRGLGQVQRRVLRTLSAFRMPATWDTLCALLVRRRWYERGSFANDRALDAVLTELEDRGLVGWDKRANRYDLHPIVRGVVWAALDPSAKQDIYGELHTYFDASPRPPETEKVESLEDLTPAVELFDKLVGLGRYQDAVVIFRDHLAAATFYRLSANRLIVELLGRLFPDGVGGLPSVAVQAQGYTLSCLARAFNSSGEPGRAEPLHRRVLEIAERNKDARNLSVDFCNLADTLRPVGRLWEAEAAARRAILKEGHLRNAGIVLAARGEGS